MYSVISVKLDSLPDNTKKQGIDTFVADQSAISPAELLTPVAGSIFRPLSQTQNLRSELRFSISPDFTLFFK